MKLVESLNQNFVILVFDSHRKRRSRVAFHQRNPEPQYVRLDAVFDPFRAAERHIHALSDPVVILRVSVLNLLACFLRVNLLLPLMGLDAVFDFRQKEWMRFKCPAPVVELSLYPLAISKRP